MSPSKRPASAKRGKARTASAKAGLKSPLRLCLDLNIWCARFLSVKAGRKNTAAQALVSIVRSGRYEEIPVQLIISWGMLDRLGTVLNREWQVPPDKTAAITSVIAQYATLGPSAFTPHLVLGGTGVVALRDDEDAHVLDTAFAGRADYLVTHNIEDFKSKDVTVLAPGKEYRYTRGGHELTIMHTYAMLPRLRELAHGQKTNEVVISRQPRKGLAVTSEGDSLKIRSR